MFNPNAKLPGGKGFTNRTYHNRLLFHLRLFVLKIAFYFWQNYLIEDTSLPKTKVAAYDLESLLQGFVQEVWLRTK